jgi:hypothetical protein
LGRLATAHIGSFEGAGEAVEEDEGESIFIVFPVKYFCLTVENLMIGYFFY